MSGSNASDSAARRSHGLEIQLRVTEEVALQPASLVNVDRMAGINPQRRQHAVVGRQFDL